MKFNRMKEIASAIQDVADTTGYPFEVLADVFNEGIADGESAEESFSFMRNVAFEHDI